MLIPKTIASLDPSGSSVDFEEPGRLEYNSVRVSGAVEIRERKYLDRKTSPFVVSRGPSAERIEISGLVNMNDSAHSADIYALYGMNGEDVKVTFNSYYTSLNRVYKLVFLGCGGPVVIRNASFRVSGVAWSIQLVFVEDRTPATLNPTGG